MKKIIFYIFSLLAACSNSSYEILHPNITLPEQTEVGKPLTKAAEMQAQAGKFYIDSRVSNKPEGLAQAFQMLDDAVKLDPHFHLALITKAGFLQELGRYSEALLACDEAIRIRPRAAEYYMLQANIFFQMKEYKKSKESLRHAIAAFNLRLEKSPQDTYAKTDRAFAVYLMGEKKIALQELSEVLKLSPNDVVVQDLKRKIETSDFKDPWKIME